MPIEVEVIESENTVILKMIGLLSTDEITNTIAEEVAARVKNQPDRVLHAIYDVTEFEWTFQEFVKYVSMRGKPQSNEGDGTVREHFVGTSQWVQQLRTWWRKQLGKETTAFSSIDSAREYIRRQNDSRVS